MKLIRAETAEFVKTKWEENAPKEYIQPTDIVFFNPDTIEWISIFTYDHPTQGHKQGCYIRLRNSYLESPQSIEEIFGDGNYILTEQRKDQ